MGVKNLFSHFLILTLAVLLIAGLVAQPVAADQHDVVLEDGQVYWKGQMLLFNHPSVDGGEKVTLQKEGENVGEVVANSNGEMYIDTSELEVADYTIYYPKEETDLASFTTTEQSIDASSESEVVYNHPNINNKLSIDIGSNRVDYTIEVSEESDKLSPVQLDSIFEDGTIVNEDGERRYHISASGDFTVEGNFSEIPSGSYSLKFSATDTSASSTVGFEVMEPDEASAKFEKSIYSEHRGDLVEMKLNTRNVNKLRIVFGDEEEKNYEYTFEIKTNGADTVPIVFDSSAAGNAVNPFYIPPESEAEIINGGPDQALTEPLTKGYYDMRVQLFNEVVAISAIKLEERSTSNIESYVAPKSDSISSVEEFNEKMTKSSVIANQDKIGFKVEVSGIYAFVNENTTMADFDRGSDFATRYGIVTSLNGNNNSLDITQGKLFVKPEEDVMYMVFDSEDLDYETGREYQMTFQLTKDNPYIREPENTEAVTSIINFEERTAEFTTKNQAGLVEVAAISGSKVVGTTTVAPGTEIQLIGRSGSPYPFVRTTTTEVDEQRQFTFNMDFGEMKPEHEFLLEVDGLTENTEAITVTEENFEIKRTGPPYQLTLKTQNMDGETINPENVTLSKDPFSETLEMSEGQATVEIDEAGTYTLNIDSEKYKSYSADIRIQEDTEYVAKLELKPESEGNKYTVKVLGADTEEPIKAASLTLDEKRLKRTNEEGKATFTLKSGEYKLLVEAPQYKSKEMTVEMGTSDSSKEVILEPRPEEPKNEQFLFGFYINTAIVIVVLGGVTYLLYRRTQTNPEEEAEQEEQESQE